jgi:hypothetical protein
MVEKGWAMKKDGDKWRRVVASPRGSRRHSGIGGDTSYTLGRGADNADKVNQFGLANNIPRRVHNRYQESRCVVDEELHEQVG